MIIVIPDDVPGIMASSNLEQEFRELGEIRVFDSPADSESLLVERLSGADVAITVGGSGFTESVLNSCPGLKHIAIFGIGVDSVDLDACCKRGITVTNTPAYSASIVAEKAIALALAAVHQIPQFDRAIRDGGWPQETVCQLHGKTLGVIGTGPIGQRVIALGKSFGMEVIAWTINPSPQRASEYGVRFLSLDDLLTVADVVSLQLPLSPLSEGLIGSHQLSLMKTSAILVNVGRGAVVDEDALVNALQGGGIASAGLDVFSTEPLPYDHPLKNLDNVVLSPHNAANTLEANRAGLAIAIQNIYNWQQGLPTNVVA
jgi:phosphoglycerate dehydrogenase-like enzyme